MSKSTTERLPVFMRIGTGVERQVGWVELIPHDFDVDKTKVADLLRRAADELVSSPPRA